MKKAISFVIFILIFALVFSNVDRLLLRKEIRGWWNVTEKIDGFYNSPQNEYDVIFYGSSNAYCCFNPLVVWEQTGVKSYVFATQQQPLWATYHYMKDSFKTQAPKLCVVDVLTAGWDKEYYEDGVNYTFCDNMPFSLNKIELVKASVPKGERFNLLVRFMKYHSRWNELSRDDFEYKKADMRDYSKGFYMLANTFSDGVKTDTSNVTEKTELLPKNEEYLRKIIKLCKDRKTELLLCKTPSNATVEEKKYYNAVEEIAKAEGVKFIDYNLFYSEIGLDLKRDFFDDNHLNIRGAEKFSRYFAKTTDFLKDKTRTDEDWQEDYEKYLSNANNF